MLRARRAWRGFWGAALLTCALARADAPVVTPPVVLRSPPLSHPLPDDEARALGPTQVALLLLITPTGEVAEASVIDEGSCPDVRVRESGLAYARALPFSPALRDGVPTAVRVPLTLSYAPPPVPLPAVPPPSAAAPAPPAEGDAFSTVVTGTRAQALRDSSDAVTVVDLGEARLQSTDLGEVLRRTQGVDLRRGGGLGSASTFALNGLYGNQVRFFVDGVPLEASGYGADVANIPVNLVERVELYKGVVPLRLGADALGGAVNVATDERYARTFASGAYQTGAFGTHRASGALRKRVGSRGFFLGANAFFDSTENDYPVDVSTTDSLGRLQAVRARRFHDGYRAGGANLEGGVTSRPWADLFLVRATFGRFDKELQHDPLMARPYGEAAQGASTWGGTLRYRKDGFLAAPLRLELLANYAQRRLRLVDDAAVAYDWFGQPVKALGRAGELGLGPRDVKLDERTVFGRLNAEWALGRSHRLQLAVSPHLTDRTGDNRLDERPGVRDVFNEPQGRRSVVSGLAWEAHPLADRVENALFVKRYDLSLWASQELMAGRVDNVRRRSRGWGYGDGVRVRVNDALSAKVSYEFATRQPTADEVFGDGALVASNPGLAPEVSHNGNVSLLFDRPVGGLGQVGFEVTGFARDTRDQIVLFTAPLVSQHQNILRTRALGVELGSRWLSPRERVSVQGNLTYTDLRNRSQGGPFGAFAGSRVPNRPFLSGFVELRVQRAGWLSRKGRAAFYWNARYVGE
ncbi:MAG TPA: TonB-dependent receptor plug domain-containing protein, partial [Myxococcaceae bacterium]|nr:TonB-dependent receptor plug domain-containing protein [Myxococcaceae bacterium]